jgi:hypothetical protein
MLRLAHNVTVEWSHGEYRWQEVLQRATALSVASSLVQPVPLEGLGVVPGVFKLESYLQAA